MTENLKLIYICKIMYKSNNILPIRQLDYVYQRLVLFSYAFSVSAFPLNHLRHLPWLKNYSKMQASPSCSRLLSFLNKQFLSLRQKNEPLPCKISMSNKNISIKLHSHDNKKECIKYIFFP